MEAIRTTLFLPQETHRRLKALAHEQRVSMAKLIQQAVGQVYFGKRRKSAKELWGCAKGRSISLKEFSDLKKRLHPKL